MNKNTLIAIVAVCVTIIVAVVLVIVFALPTDLKTCEGGRQVPVDENCPLRF